MKLLKRQACLWACRGGNDRSQTVMEETGVNRLSDRGSTPLWSIWWYFMKHLKKQLKRILTILILSTVLVLPGCDKNSDTVPMQFEKQEDQRLIRINIRDRGAVTFRLFYGQEPDAVSELIEKAKNGYYNGTSFYEIIEDYLIMGGNESSDGSNKVKAKGSGDLYPFKGALCTTLNSDGTCPLNNFYIITLDTDELKNIEELVEHKGYTLSDYIKFGYKTELTVQELENFRTYGGAPWMYGHTVVLGQVIEGFEVLENIIELENEDGEESEVIVIDSIETD